MRRCLHILCVILQRLVILFQRSSHLDKPIQHGLPNRRFLIGALKDPLAVLQPFRRLIYLADQAESPDIPDALPVNRIRQICGCFIILLINQPVNLFQLKIVLIFVQFIHPVILYSLDCLLLLPKSILN